MNTRRWAWGLLAAAGIVAAGPLVVPSGAAVYGRTLWVEPAPAGAASAWYRSGGAPAPVGAWAAKGAASAAMARTSLVGSATLGEGATPPSWAASDGWTWVTGATLTSSLRPARGWAVLVRFAAGSGTGNQALIQWYQSSQGWQVNPVYSNTYRLWRVGSTTFSLSGVMREGCMGILSDTAVWDGTSRAITGAGVVPSVDGIIGSGLVAGTRITSLAIWSTALTAAQAAAICAAMP